MRLIMMNKFTFILSGLVVFGLAACDQKPAADNSAEEPVIAAVEPAATEPAA